MTNGYRANSCYQHQMRLKIFLKPHSGGENNKNMNKKRGYIGRNPYLCA